MALDTPRDTPEWIRIVERRLGAAERNAGRIAQTVVERELGPILGNIGDTAKFIAAAPVEVTTQTSLYLTGDGRQRARVVVDFPDVTRAIDETTIAVDTYEMEGVIDSVSVTASAYPNQLLPGVSYPNQTATASRQSVDSTPIPMQRMATSGVSTFRVDDLEPGRVLRFRVRALSGMEVLPGRWSREFSVILSKDTQGPPQPTAPVLTVARGTITATWDGQSVIGAMPADTKYAILAVGAASSPEAETYRFGPGGGFTVIADLDYYTPYFFRVRAMDESGNWSPWSEQAISYIEPLVNKDIILSTIDAAKTHLKNIDAGVSILENTIIAEHLLATESLTAKVAQFLEVKADMIDVNSLAADEVFTGLLDAKLVVSDMFEGKRFSGGEFVGANFSTSVEANAGLKMNSTGIHLYAPTSGVETFTLDAVSGNVTIKQGTFTGVSFQTSAAASRGLKIDSTNGLRAWDSTGRLSLSIGSVGQQNLLVGTMETNYFGMPRIALANESNHGLPALFFFQANATSANVGLQSALYLNDNGGNTELIIRGVHTSVMPAPPTTNQAGIGYVTIAGNLKVTGGFGNPSTVQLNGWTRLEAKQGTQNHRLDIEGSTLFLYSWAGETVIDSQGQATRITEAYNRTTTAGVNIHVAPNGALFRSTSASRRKLDQRVLDIPDALLDVPMKDWYDRGEMEQLARIDALPRPLSESDQRTLDSIHPGLRYAGWIAEEVDAAGGGMFVQRGMDGLVEGIEEPRFVGAQVQVLSRRLRAIESRIAQLEGEP